MTDAPSTSPAPRTGGRQLLLLGLVALVAGLILLPGLGAGGLWSAGEIPILDRTLAELGESRAELSRSPWLPDALRTWCYAIWPRDFALRLPGACAGLGLVMLTLATARKLGWSSTWTTVAAGYALALPLLLASSRTVLGDVTGELWVSAAVILLLTAGNQTPARGLGRRLLLAVAGLGCLGASVASSGIVLGGCLPLTLVALADLQLAGRGAAKTEQSDGQHPVHLPRAMVLGAWAAAAGCGFVGLWLAWHQGDGYIPLLGAAKDLALIDDPTKRGFADSFEEFGYQVFPFTGLIVVGLLSPGRARWPALWLGTALVMGSLWSLRYGPTPVPVVIPAALLATAATERLLDPKEPIAARRLLLCCAILAAMILGKDAGRTPAHVASPLLALSPLHFPAAHLHLDERLPALAKRFAALLLLAHFIAPPSLDQLRWREGRETPAWLRVWQRIEAVLDRLLTGNRERAGLDRARTLLPVGLLLLGLLGQSVDYGRRLLDDLGAELSIAGPMRRWDAGIHDGTIPHARLGLYRIDDPGLRHYGPGPQREEFLANRVDLDRWIYDDRPRTVLMRRSDLPGAYANARTHGEPFYVLDASHDQYVLVSNFLPPETDDQNPLKRFVVAESPQLANETLVAWDPYLELVGWEIEGPVHRGSKPVLHLEFRVQRPLPAGAKLYARLQKGKVSRVSAMPHELGGNGELPPNYWRAGDIIHDRIQLEVPWLEVMPGEHDLIVGMRRSETSNFRMTRPEGDEGEFGVVMKNTAHEFAVIGQVPISW